MVKDEKLRIKEKKKKTNYKTTREKVDFSVLSRQNP